MPDKNASEEYTTKELREMIAIQGERQAKMDEKLDAILEYQKAYSSNCKVCSKEFDERINALEDKNIETNAKRGLITGALSIAISLLAILLAIYQTFR